MFFPFPTFSWVIAVFPSWQQNSFSPLVKIARDRNSTIMKGIFMLPKLSSAVQIYQCASQNNFCRAGSHRPLRVSHFHTAYLQRGIFMQFTPIPLQLPAAVGWLDGRIAQSRTLNSQLFSSCLQTTWLLSFQTEEGFFLLQRHMWFVPFMCDISWLYI